MRGVRCGGRGGEAEENKTVGNLGQTILYENFSIKNKCSQY